MGVNLADEYIGELERLGTRKIPRLWFRERR